MPKEPPLSIFDLDLLLSPATGRRKTVCKFVLLRNGTNPVLAFGSVRSFPYHAHLVNACCTRLNIPAAWVKKPDVVEVLKSDAVVEGGGWLELDTLRQTMSFYGKSTAYGGFDTGRLQSILDEWTAVAGFNISIS
ncbi:MAG: hypothetical protein ABIE70_00875 [bacterium]